MSKKKSVISISVIVLTVILCVAGGIGYYLYTQATTAYKGEDVRVYVDSASGNEGLRDSLTAALGDDYGALVYDIYGKIATADAPRSGSFVIHRGDKAYATARRIQYNQQDPVKVVFNNLRTLDQLAQRIDRQLLIDDKAFIAAVDSTLRADNYTKAEYPSFCFPDTYEFYWNATPEKVVDKIKAHHDRFWDDTRLAKAAKLGLTPAQVSTLASIVEEETNKADERPKVARLYLNRLDKGMKLQADPTVKYAVGDFALRRITAKHLETPSPYNTYLHYGLPPGPIRIVEARSIDAVLDAPRHNYIYMCAKEDFSGYHNFAVDYETHKANARRYQQALDRNGIH